MENQNTIIITAKIINPSGKEIFHSEHKEAVPVDAEAKTVFAAMTPPVERVLTDAYRKFIPADEE